MLSVAVSGFLWGGGLIFAAIFGLGAMIKAVSLFISVMTYGGAAFLNWYGIKAFGCALNPTALGANDLWLGQPRVWQALDLVIAAIMFASALKILTS